ncbi:TPA: hypothetical protein ACFRG8_001251 [Neisseria lactamica]|uniref:hypothetical protein n=1 Tax=Neisseria lactamica TaxID=486 RepID=UPI0003189683|nr:hypothetical protein [Neisseria lactamica]
MDKNTKDVFLPENGAIAEFAAPFAQPRYDVDGAGVWYIGVKTDREGNYRRPCFLTWGNVEKSP